MSALGFDVAYYLSVNRDVAAALAQRMIPSALTHFEQYGAREGRNPNPAFDADYYLAQNPDVRAAVAAGIFASAWDHYRVFGASEGRLSSSDQLGFDATAYLAANPDLIRAGHTLQTALGHYVMFGLLEGRMVAPVAQTALTTSAAFGATDDPLLPGAGLAPTVRITAGGQGQAGDTLLISAAAAPDLAMIDLTQTDDQNRTQTVSGTEAGPTLTGFENIDGSRALIGLALTGALRTDTGATQTGSVLIGGSGRDTLIGSDGADSLIGNAGNDSIVGGAGNDTLSGGIGNDSQWGGSGDDILRDAGGDDRAYGQAGNDWIDLGDGRNLAEAGDGNDTIIANQGFETLLGGAGHDRFILSASSLAAGDVIDGEAGQDLLYLAGGTVPLVIDTGAATLRNLDALAFVNAAADGRPSQFRLVLTDAFLAANGRDAGLILDARGLADGSRITLDFSQLTAASAVFFSPGSIRLLLSPGTEVIDQNGTRISGGYTVSAANSALSQVSPFLVYAQLGVTAGEGAGLNADGTIQIPIIPSPPLPPPVTPPSEISLALTTGLTDSLVPTEVGTNEAFTGGAGTLNGTDAVNGRGGTDSLTLTAQTGTINAAGTAMVIDIDRIALQTASNTVLNGSGFTLIGEVILTGSGNLTVQTPSTDLAANTVFVLGSGYANTLTDSSNALQKFGLDGSVTGSALTTGRSGLSLEVRSASTLGTLMTGGGTVTVTGAGALTLGSFGGATLLDGSAMTGALTFTVPVGVSVQSGSGSDTITLGGGGLSVLTGTGNDTVVGGGNVSATTTLTGGAGNDLLTLTSSLGATSLDRVSQFETIQLADGSSYSWTPTGGSAHATDTTAVVLDGSALTGASTLTFVGVSISGHAMTITGGMGGDSIDGGSQADRLVGGEGGDTLGGGGGSDTILGEAGNDTLYGHAGTDSLVGGNGNDFLAGGSEVDTLNGGLGDDSLDGGAGNDSLIGGSGNDYIFGDVGNDLMFGDDGNDALDGGDGGDVLDPGTGDDVLDGGDGADSFYVGDDLTVSDTVRGGDGADTLNVTGRNADTDLDGVTEVELIQFADGVSYQYVISAGSSHAMDTTTSVSYYAGTLVSWRSFNFDASNITGRGVTVTGGAGADSLVGSGQADVLQAGLGADTLSGGGGNDTIQAGLGADRVSGGGGSDEFYYFSNHGVARTAETLTAASIGAGETLTFGNGVDIITDFTTGSDRLRVTNPDNYTLLTTGSNASALTAYNHYGLRGNFSAGVFTVNDAGADTLLLIEAAAGAFDTAAQTGALILLGVTNFAVTDLMAWNL